MLMLASCVRTAFGCICLYGQAGMRAGACVRSCAHACVSLAVCALAATVVPHHGSESAVLTQHG
jgi:hypothetical protein